MIRLAIRGLDRYLCRRLGVFEFSEHPDCVFRVSLACSEHPIRIPDGEVLAGAKVLELHLWNDHIPPLPPGGPDLAWGVRGQRMLVSSCRQLASHLESDSRMADVEAVGGTTALFFTGGLGGKKIFRRLGFTVAPHQNSLGRFGEFWENIWVWMIMWAYNAATLRQRRLLKLRRTEVWMSTGEFLRRYGSAAAARPSRVAS